MKIKTDTPLLPDPSKLTKKVARYWDQTSEGWRKIWGPHIHHGFYDSSRLITPLEAQEILIKKLAAMLEVAPQDHILDVGCGMGGSSLFLTKQYHAIVTGITLSKKQVGIATQQAQMENINNVYFKVEDALSLSSFHDNSFDIVWSLESCEQFYDKNLFLQQAMRVLKPGGKLMLATWCSSCDEYEGTLAKKYRNLCLAFDLPYMPTMEHYCHLLKTNHFDLQTTADWSSQVKKSWDIGISLAHAYSFLQIVKLAGWRGWRFTKQASMMQEAFRLGSVKYGVFIANKPLIM